MSAWGDIQSFGGKRLQDGGFGPIDSNRVEHYHGYVVADELLRYDLWIPWDILSWNCLVYRDPVLEYLKDFVENRSFKESLRDVFSEKILEDKYL